MGPILYDSQMADVLSFVPSGVASYAFDTEKLLRHEQLPRAAALFIRSKTLVDQKLWHLAPQLQFIGSATSGADHFRVTSQEAWRNGVYLYYAAGCNSRSVVEYVVTVLLRWRFFELLPAGARIGVVGAGHIGGQLVHLLPLMGFEVDFFDPHVSYEDLLKRWGEVSDKVTELACAQDLARADVVTFHVPLVGEEQNWPTVSFVPQYWQPRRDQLLINSSRGEVVALDWLAQNPVYALALDVFPDEPYIDRHFWGVQGLEDTLFTPHIAGYSREGWHNGSAMVAREYVRFAGGDPPEKIGEKLNGAKEAVCWLSLADIFADGQSDPEILYRLAMQSMPLDRDSDSLRRKPELFGQMRKNYPLRREFRYYGLKLPAEERAERLGLVHSLCHLGFAVGSKG